MDLNFGRTILASAMTLVMPGFTSAQTLQRQMLEKSETTEVSVNGVVKNFFTPQQSDLMLLLQIRREHTRTTL